MKKTFFYALLFAAASMTFVACGSKEISRAEQAVRAVEAAKSYDEIMAIDKEYSDLTEDDFSAEQKERIERAIIKLNLDNMK